jgi:hypothetical protein
MENNPRVVHFFTDMFAPEESFFHTILGNSSFMPRVRRNLHYEDWSAQGSRPAMITAGHIQKLRKCDKIIVDDAFGSGEVLFARKLSDANLQLLQEIDEMIESKEQGGHTSGRSFGTDLDFSRATTSGA